MLWKLGWCLPACLMLHACHAETSPIVPSSDHADLPAVTQLLPPSDAPVRQIAVDAKYVYQLDANGVLWQVGHLKPSMAQQTQTVAAVALSPHATVAANAQIAGVHLHHGHAVHRLWRDDGHAADGQQTAAADAGKMWVGDCLIAAEQGDTHVYPVRLCVEKTTLQRTAAEQFTLLPDAQPILWQNKVLFLGEPDAATYPHGVLGDKIEAKTLYTLDVATLQARAAAFRLPDGLVFENNTLTLWGDKVVAVVSGADAGARLVVLALHDGQWRIEAQSEALPSNRWQSPFVFQNQLYAVQMPHFRGRLVRYEIRGARLLERPLGEGVSNHMMGSRHTQVAAVLPDYVLLPDMAHRRLWALSGTGHLKPLMPQLPAHIVYGVVQNGRSYWLLADGSVWTWSVH